MAWFDQRSIGEVEIHAGSEAWAGKGFKLALHRAGSTEQRGQAKTEDARGKRRGCCNSPRRPMAGAKDYHYSQLHRWMAGKGIRHHESWNNHGGCSAEAQ